jgi:LacI family transcriptional regulator/LacI family repressor for deo operon, udp, cdd, tsx, nupC, and nupG
MARLQDVARIAEVSISTVSRVINEPELVNKETRRRVQKAIDELGYLPNRVARRLRGEGGGAKLIGLVLPDIQNPFFADLARGVEDVAQQHGYLVFLGNSDEDAAKEKRYLDVMRAESVDGIIVPPSSETDEAVADLVRRQLPVVCVDRRLLRGKVDTVLVDNVRGAAEAMEHLIGLGHHRIGFIEGLPQLSTSRERLQGYRQALEDHGISFDPSLVRQGDSRQESGRELTRELLELPDRPTALLVGNNLMTLGSLVMIHQKGLRIPEDVAILGYDDMPWALALNPPLTAVRQPGDEVGRRAMELLLQRIRDPQRSVSLVMMQPELVVRKSCGAGLARGGEKRVRAV